MLHRWSIRLPLWAAVAIVALVYLLRSAMRGFDFRPDLPGDAVVLVLFVVVLAAVAYVRRTYGDDGSEDCHDEDRPNGGAGADL